MNEFVELTDEDMALLESVRGAPRRVARHSVIRASGAPVTEIFLLLEGWVASSIPLSDGQRQIAKLHLPGDILGSPSMVLETAMETLTALTPAMVASMPLAAFGEIFHRAPRVAAAMFLGSQQERVILTDRVASLGRTPAPKRIGALLLHIYDRLRVIDPDQPAEFDVPLTQEQMGDVLGITPVHVNRTLKELESAGLIVRRGHSFRIEVGRLRAYSGSVERQWVRDPHWMRPARMPESV